MSFYVKPITLSRELRKLLKQALSFKFHANDSFRFYLKQPVGVIVSFEDLVEKATLYRYIKRSRIPHNMLYNRHVRSYWKQHPTGSLTQCVRLWNESKSK